MPAGDRPTAMYPPLFTPLATKAAVTVLPWRVHRNRKFPGSALQAVNCLVTPPAVTVHCVSVGREPRLGPAGGGGEDGDKGEGGEYGGRGGWGSEGVFQRGVHAKMGEGLRKATRVPPATKPCSFE